MVFKKPAKTKTWSKEPSKVYQKDYDPKKVAEAHENLGELKGPSVGSAPAGPQDGGVETPVKLAEDYPREVKDWKRSKGYEQI